MLKSRGTWLAIGLGLGLVIGLNVAGIWPQIPIHATATHGQENFALCTGDVDGQVEAVTMLDYLTGDLTAVVLGVNTRMFNTVYRYNVNKDFESVKNPKYLLVSGRAEMRRALAVPIGNSVVYVAEMTSGQLAAYGLPWSPGRESQAGNLKLTFLPLDKFPFRTIPIRGGRAGK